MDTDYESEGQETSSSFIYSHKETSPTLLPDTFFNQKKSISDIGLSYKAYLFLLKLSRSGSSVTSHSFDTIFPIVFKIFHLLLLSDIEIVLWEIYLDRFGWQASYARLKESLLFAAYAAKCVLNESTAEVLENLKSEPQWKLDGYINWLENFQNMINVDFYELNVKYNELSYAEVRVEVKEDDVDYNLAVDELIESTLETQKRRKSEL
ncbi:unnamed protein product [Blepharisma stoltei]|uniref:Uncharacterized protein n=1 Tax=Blepharisma stoltei TaxID=1481888 RepID=A0AAU9K2M6_9CILI|nr:unnamed protein product [Blepharisma stoltei]